MKAKINTFHKLTVLMSAAFLLTAIPAIAQLNDVVKFDAPFAFYAGNAKMPAGSYTLTNFGDNAEVLHLESADRSHSAFVKYITVEEIIPPSSTGVSFNQYGKTDFLNRISLQGENSEMQILPSTAERDADQAAGAVQHSLSIKSAP